MDNNLFINADAEMAIIGLILSEGFDNIIQQLMPEEFAIEEHRKIFSAIQILHSQKTAIDLITAERQCSIMYGEEDRSKLVVKMVECTQEFSLILAAKYNIKVYISYVKDAAIRRKMLKIIEEAKNELTMTMNETAVIIDKTRQELRDIVVVKDSWKSMTDVMMATYQAIENRSRGEEPIMTSGVPVLDSTITGFHKGELTIIGARPAVGKSAFGANIALATAAQGYKVGICSREMTDVQYGQRIFLQRTEVDNRHLRTGQLDDSEWTQLAQAIGPLTQFHIDFAFSTRYIEDLRMEVQKQVDAGNLDMLIVDYIQQMQSKYRFEKDYLRIGYVSKTLKDMSVDFNISVVALAQVGRSTDRVMPTLSDLRGSGDLEQDADNVIFMHRPSDSSDRYVHPQDRAYFDDYQRRGLQYIALNVAKQRQGEIGTMAVIFDPSRMRYTAIDRRGEQ